MNVGMMTTWNELAVRPVTTLDGTNMMLPNGTPLRVGHVLADAILTRKAPTSLEQLAAYTQAQEFYTAASGGQVQWAAVGNLGADVPAMVEALQRDVEAYAANQTNVLVCGQVQLALVALRATGK